MLTAHDVYQAWRGAYATYTQVYHQTGIAVPLPTAWEELTTVQREQYAHMARLLNERLGLWASDEKAIVMLR